MHVCMWEAAGRGLAEGTQLGVEHLPQVSLIICFEQGLVGGLGRGNGCAWMSLSLSLVAQNLLCQSPHGVNVTVTISGSTVMLSNNLYLCDKSLL